MVSPMDPSPRPPEGDSKALYVAIGCAVFLVVGLCVASGAGVWYFTQRTEEVVTAPVPGVAEPKPPLPQQPPPQQPGRPIVPGPGGPTLPPPPAVPTAPRIVNGTVTAVDGSAPVAVGAACNFNVRRQPRPDMPNGYWCNAQIVCGGKLLYGGPNAGYFPCTVGDTPPSVIGSDASTSSSDTDAAIDLNTPGGTLTVRDDVTGAHGQYTLTARIDQVL